MHRRARRITTLLIGYAAIRVDLLHVRCGMLLLLVISLLLGASAVQAARVLGSAATCPYHVQTPTRMDSYPICSSFLLAIWIIGRGYINLLLTEQGICRWVVHQGLRLLTRVVRKSALSTLPQILIHALAGVG